MICFFFGLEKPVVPPEQRWCWWMGPVVQSRRGDRKEIRSALTGRAGTFGDLGMEAWTFQGNGTYPTEKGVFFFSIFKRTLGWNMLDTRRVRCIGSFFVVTTGKDVAFKRANYWISSEVRKGNISKYMLLSMKLTQHKLRCHTKRKMNFVTINICELFQFQGVQT